MILPNKIRILFKTISCLVAGIFLFQQVAWAGDLIETVLNKQADAQAQTFAPAYLQNQQSIQENVIVVSQDAENFQNLVTASAQVQDAAQPEPDNALPLKGPRGGGEGTAAPLAAAAAAQTPPALSAQDDQGTPDSTAPILSVTTAAGDIIHYKGNKIDSIEKKDGTVLRNIVVDESNNLAGAEITYTDGTVQIIAGGKVTKLTRPDGTIYSYNSDELIESVIYPDNKTAIYSYTKEQGKVIETAVTDSEKVSIYDAANKLKHVKFINSKKEIFYDSGILSKAVDTDGTAYLYNKSENGSGSQTTYTVRLSEIDSQGNRYIIENNNIVRVETTDGTAYYYKPVLSADFNLDGTVDISDLACVLANYNKSNMSYFNGDSNGDGIVDATDLARVLANYNQRVYVAGTNTSLYDGNNNLVVTIYADGHRDIYTRPGSLFTFEQALNIAGSYDAVCEYDLSGSLTRKVIQGITYYYKPILTADFNLDGAVDGLDLDRFKSNCGKTNASYFDGDANGDGAIDGLDLDYFKANCGRSAYVAGTNTSFYDGNNNLAVTIYSDGHRDIYPYIGGLFTLEEAEASGITRQGVTISEGAFNIKSAILSPLEGLPLSGDIGFLGGAFNDNGTLKPDRDFSAIPYFDTITYSQDKEVSGITKPNGDVVAYKDGLVDRILSGSGSEVTQYSYNLASADTINEITVDRDGIKSIYDEYGKIKSVQDSETGLSFSMTNNAVSRIQKEDGTIIEDAIYDDAGKIVSAKITKPDDVVTIYSGGLLAEIREPNGGIFYYDVSGDITKYDKSGLVYDYSEELEGDETFTVAVVSDADLAMIKDPDEIVFQKYDSSKRLVQLKKKSGKVIDYSYALDPEGKVTAITTNDGVVVTIYDKDYNITRTEVLATADDPVATISEYSYGKIRRVLKGDELIYTYTYEYDGSGKEIAVIKDIKTGDVKRYKDELLISVTDKNNLVTTYEYSADKKISKSVVSRSGQVVNRYAYSYEGDLTTMEDMDGTKRTYDKDNRIVYLEEGGRTYQYSYSKDDSGKDITTQKLIRCVNESGDTINYVNDEMESIVKADGAVLKDFIFVNKDVSGYTIQKGDAKYYVKDGIVTKEARADGTVIEYYPSGWAKSVTALDGTVTNYAYEVDTTATPTMDGSLQNTALVKNTLQLSSYTDTATKLLLHMNDATDSSASSHAVTFYGDAHIDTTVNKLGSGALALDGRGDYLTLPNSDDWNFGTGDFTVDCWVKFNKIIATVDRSIIWSRNQNWLTDNLYLMLYGSDDSASLWLHTQNVGFEDTISSGLTWATDVWYHIAVVSTGGVIKLYRNGVDVTSSSGTKGVPNLTAPLCVGYFEHQGGATSYYFNGYIDEFRVSKGIARWTSNFSDKLPDDEYHNPYYNIGSFTSKAIKLDPMQLNTISWAQTTPAGAGLTVQTRTGNTSNPDDGTWSDWSGALTDPSGSQITSPLAKYIQYKVSMTTTDLQVTPEIKDIKIGYAAKSNNTSPQQVAYITAERDGIKYRYDKDGKLLYIEDNNTRYFYNADNMLIKAIDSGGREYNYEYSGSQSTVTLNDAIKQSFVNNLDGFVKENLSVDNLNNIIAVKLARNQGIDYGDGRDSDLRVEAGQTIIIDGTKNYKSIYVAPGATLTVTPWNGSTGGELILKCQGSVYIAGTISVNGKGYRGGAAGPYQGHGTGYQGESYNGLGIASSAANNSGGGAGVSGGAGEYWLGYGGGGGYGEGGSGGGKQSAGLLGGAGGTTYGDAQLAQFTFGGGGGGCSGSPYGIAGGAGGGKVKIAATSITVSGSIIANGANGVGSYGDGGGAGGAVWLQADNVSIIGGSITVSGGSPSPYGGTGVGGSGRIRIDYGTLTGSASAASLYLDQLMYNNQGSLTSDILPITATELGSINASINTPAGTSIIFKTRTGESSDVNDGSWSDWIAATKDAGSYKINSSLNKYIQYQAILQTTDVANTPSISQIGDYAVKLTYNYNKAFDATAPPADVPFKDHLTLTPQCQPAIDVQSLNYSPSEISQFSDSIKKGMTKDDSILRTVSFKADLLSRITMPDGTIIKYFNNKPVSITRQGAMSISDIILEKYNVAIMDYKVENGLLIGYSDPSADKVIASFAAADALGNSYIFKSNKLVEIRRAGGTVEDMPQPDAFATAALDLLERAFSPDDMDGERTLENSDVSINLDKSSKVTYFINNKMAATYYRHDDGQLDLLVDYSYDDSGNLIMVRLPYARDSIDSQMAVAQQNIAAEKESYLRTLAQQKGLAYQNIYDNVESVRAQINAERARLSPYLYQEVRKQRWVGWWIFGWWETYSETVEVPEVRNALNQLNEQERILNEQAANAYAALDDQVKAAQDKLVKDESDSLNEISRQKEIFHAKIVEEESTPVIVEAYRSVLGRDPDDAETASLLAQVSYDSKIDAAALKANLAASGEQSVQETFVAGIKTDIAGKLNEYLNADAASRQAILDSLGLADSEAVSLDQAEVDAILAFLDKQNIHFGRSAFVSLEALLKENNISYDLKDLALKTILVDIFTGSISAVSEGDLVEFSMFALSKVASLYGLTLYNTKVTLDELAQIFNSSGTAIAHFKNNHFVVVNNIAADGKVTYTELNKGKDGRTYTVSKEDFKNGWTGYAMVQKQSPKGAVPEWVSSKIISAEMARHIRGSCFFFLFVLIGVFIQGVATIAAGVVAGIAAVVAAVSAVIAPIISAIGAFIVGVTDFLAGIAAQIFTAIQFVGVSLLHGVGAFFGGTLFGGSISSVVSSVTGFASTIMGTAIGKTVVLTALSFSISKGLDAIGLNPIASNLISSFLTGGISGLFSSGFTALSFITGSLQGLAVQGVSILGQRLGLDTNLSSVLSLAAGSLIGAGLNGIKVPIDPSNLELGYRIIANPGLDAINYSLRTTILPSVAGELAYYGVNKVGELLGVDSRISYLAGIGIRSSISAGLSNEWKPEAIWGSVQNGLLRGITNVGLEWGAEALGLSPLVGSLTSAAIAGGIEALLMGQNPIQGIFDTYFRAGTGMLTLGGDGGNNPWLRAAYISQVLDFSHIIQERGIVNALETYAAGFLQQQTINEIWKQGGIAELLTKPNQIEITTNAKGETVKRIYTMTINSASDKLLSNYIDLSPTYDMLVGYRQGNVITHCDFVIGPDGRPQLKNGEREVLNADGSKRVEYVDNFNLTKMDYVDAGGNKTGYYIPATGTGSIIVGADGKVTSGKFVSLVTDYSVSTKNNQVTDFGLKRDYVFSEAQRTNLLNSGIAEQNLYGFKEVVSFANGMLQYFVLPPDTPIFNIDQGAGKAWLDSIEADGRAFWQGVYGLYRDAIAGDPVPQFASDSLYPYATIDLNLPLPGRSEATIAALDTLYLISGSVINSTNSIGSFLTSNSTWNRNTDYSAQLYAASFDAGYKFVFGGGANTDGLNQVDRETFYYLLNTSNTIGVGNSADSVSVAKSWLIADAVKADHYFLTTPQLPPEEVAQNMRLGGINPGMLTVVEVAGDFPPRWLSKYSDNRNTDGSLKWNYVKILDGPGVSQWNWFSSHSVPTQGVLSGGLYTVEVNGVVRTGVTLAEIYSEQAN